jgi:transposase
MVNIREYVAHTATTEIVGVHKSPNLRPSVIVTNGYNVKKMVERENATTDKKKKTRKRCVRGVMDAAVGRIRNFLKYKSEHQGTTFEEADEFYLSTQTCSHCGYVLQGNERLEAQKTFKCPKCKLKIDRDDNSSYNVKNA